VKLSRQKKKREVSELRREALKANAILGIKDVSFCNFSDNRFDRMPLLDVVRVIERAIEKIKPEIIFTHRERTLNIDHQIAYKAVVTATRPLPAMVVRQVYSFEVLSSSEWAYPLDFSPNVFFDITMTIALKLKALKAYASEIREFPHPRSVEGVKLNAKTWGMKLGARYVEAFELVRMLK